MQIRHNAAFTALIAAAVFGATTPHAKSLIWSSVAFMVAGLFYLGSGAEVPCFVETIAAGGVAVDHNLTRNISANDARVTGNGRRIIVNENKSSHATVPHPQVPTRVSDRRVDGDLRGKSALPPHLGLPQEQAMNTSPRKTCIFIQCTLCSMRDTRDHENRTLNM